MTDADRPPPALTPLEREAAAIVDEYLRLAMIPDPEAAARFVSKNLVVTFTGGRPMRTPADTTAFNARRYAWVRKRIARTDVVAGGSPECTIVYSLGTLHGAWPDGTPFEGNRYVDRFEVSHGLIVKQDVWNDSAERIMIRAGLVG
ncbi:MAG TPA: nuclear transport factor 2 family protein [Burkholderiaceae bacterium]|nr:nuclear transport factor 2 family protein [Burkholderiaceae bacterium]